MAAISRNRLPHLQQQEPLRLCICDIPFEPGSHEYVKEALTVERMRRHANTVAMGYPVNTSRRERRRFKAFKREMQSLAGERLNQDLQDP
eukprot:4787333-Karenia_brevis.AAC.1